MEIKLILCECGWSEHQMILTFFTGEDDEQHQLIYAHFYLNRTFGFLKRLWHGLRYAFGYHCRFGHWDEVMMNKKTVIELQEFLSQFLQSTEAGAGGGRGVDKRGGNDD